MAFRTFGLDLVIDDSVAETVAVTKVLVGLPTLTYVVENERGPGGGWPVVAFTTETRPEMDRFLRWYASDESDFVDLQEYVYEV